jgi:hypothetical protein
MSWYPDLSTQTMVASGDHVRAIGWLSSDQPFPQGEVSAEFMSKLDEFVRLAPRSSEALSFPAFGGWHECEFCERPSDPRALGPRGYGNFGVPDGGVLYIAPELVAHYVRVHGYQPPAEFVGAVMASPLPDTPEYGVLVEPFARLRQAEWDRFFQRQIDYAGKWAFEHGGTEEAIREAVNMYCWYPRTESQFERVKKAMRDAEAGGLQSHVDS